METTEEWRPVVEAQGLYEVSSHGRVRSLWLDQRHPGRILRAPLNDSGYRRVNLHVGDKRLSRKVHRLVGEAFLGPLPKGLVTRHLDGNKLNNRRENLKYGTVSENEFDKVAHGQHFQASKDRCKHGHLFTPENTRIDLRPDGSFWRRSCRKCVRKLNKETRLRRLAIAEPCSAVECDDPVLVKGLCSKHYKRQWKANKAARAA